MNVSAVEKTNAINSNLVYKMIYFAGFFLFFLWVFHQELNAPFGDIYGHIKLVSQWLAGTNKMPHVGFEITIYYISKLTHLSLRVVSITVMAVAITILAYMIFWLLQKLAGLSQPLALLSTTCLMTVSAIYVPFFNKNIYLGQGSPNVWHSPTLITVKPFALMVTYLIIPTLTDKKTLDWAWVSILLLASLVYKPSFVVIFVPALFIYLIIHRPKDRRIYWQTGIALIPVALYFLYQCYIVFFQFDIGKSSIFISLFAVLHLMTPNIFVSLLLAILFPLILTLFRFKQVIANKHLQLIWIMFVVAYLQMALLAEGGIRFSDANFFWGYMIVLQLLFVFSFIEYAKWIKAEYFTQNLMAKLKIRLVTLVFGLHLISGIYYLLKIASKHGYS